MNKPALKKFATEARRELLERVELQARKIGITSEGIRKASIESSDAIFIDGKQLKEKERVQRNKLINRIREIGFDRVMEEVSYTWFNRFTALRFMEVNDYLPTKVRVLSSLNPESTEPDMMKEALNLDLDLDKEYIYELKMNNNDEELFKYLIIKHCNDLNRYMPFMFETIDDYTEILFPQGLLATDSCIQKITNIEMIPENNWGRIEVIGWLYQYYIAEEKDRVFKAKKKYKAEEIPFATQLFTPDWIVRYMVQNSLGRYWVEANPEHQDLIVNWEFYLQNTEENFAEKIAPYINKELKVEEIKCFDPAMGSGHILVYMFDVLYEIYNKSGYMEREIPRLIIENNLFGLDIDDRAYQLASFSVVMKAMEYNKRFLKNIEREGLVLNLASIQETNSFTPEDIEFIAGNIDILEETENFLKQFQHAKTIGSLIKVTDGDTRNLEKRMQSIQTTVSTDLFEFEKREKVLFLLPKIIKQAQIMALEFDVLVTNPPYMGASSMNKELTEYLKKHYPDSKADLFAAFMEIDDYLKTNGFIASINQHSWMFLSSFQKLRKKLIENKFIESMLHLGPRAFEEIGGEVVQATTFVIRNFPVSDIEGNYIRLVDEKVAGEKRSKAIYAIENSDVPYRYSVNQENFMGIPAQPIAYWTNEVVSSSFKEHKNLGSYAEIVSGMTTGNNDKYMRDWKEVSFEKIALYKENLKAVDIKSTYWFPYNKGGAFRRWYGNNEYVVNWGKSHEFNRAKTTMTHLYLKRCITWSDITSDVFSARACDIGFFFDVKGSCAFPDEKTYYPLIALLNSKVAIMYIKMLNPTITTQVGDLKRIPFNRAAFDPYLTSLSKLCVDLAKFDWDSYESSWDFRKHPLLISSEKDLNESYEIWENITEQNFQDLKNSEEKIDKFFIDLYDLNDEISYKVDEKYVSIRKANKSKDIRSLIAYSIGCMLGRYSLDEEGLIFAGGKFEISRYKSFNVDEDNILPILSEAYFSDDITNRFIDFIKLTFKKESIEENLSFIADALGKKKNETARETLRRYFQNEFYKDHVQIYKKRPIYWLFNSGKEKAFNCLIYMHRYDKTTLSRIRTDYLHEVQTRMDSEKKDLLNIIDGDSSAKEISNAKKELKSLDKKIDELKAYDEKLHHMADMQIEIDLDDGVAVNYAKFEGLVAKI